jgi:EAL domain-containing protein (putative c-di-GMP-specific phosphodiesterase class I)
MRVHYQPIVELSTGNLVGFEALVRWQHNGEVIGADRIIQVAEETGLIIPIGRWVLGEALRQLAEWDRSARSRQDLEMHVNLSARQLLQPNLVDQVTEALAEHAIAPERLHLEVTESVLIDSAEHAAALLRMLHEIGVGLSLDDFGTGYSSLSSLRQFPFDVLKIDRSFVADTHDVRRSDEIVQTVTRLASALGMQVTIEGVETAEQRTRMKGLGIEFAQGYYFARPASPEQILEEGILENGTGNP